MKKITTIIMVLTCLLTLASYSQTSQSDTTEYLNRTSLLKYIYKMNAKFPDVVYAQALIESGSLKSHICRKNNNLFGMRFPEYRVTTAIGKAHGYAVYENWQASVQDYCLFQNKVLDNKNWTKAQYLNYLGRKYAEGRGYKMKILASIRYNNEHIVFANYQDSTTCLN